MSTLPSRDEVVKKARRVVEERYEEKLEKLNKTYEEYVKEVEAEFMETAKAFRERLPRV
ncbi:hypothetical protein [Stetteria hydrogenophila]